MTTRAQGDLPKESGILKTARGIARRAPVHYASMLQGDRVESSDMACLESI
jgi:hypothetical protein